MRFLRVFLVCCCSWGLGIPGQIAAQLAPTSPRMAFPEVAVWLIAQETLPADTTETILRFGVQIPPDHHGYLDTGDEGLFIPLSFSFPTWASHGIQVVLRTHSPGEREDTVHATVLRGQGEFTFGVPMPSTRFLSDDTVALTFRYQICNDVTRLCYPPQERTMSLRALAEGPQGAAQAPTLVQQPPVSFTLNERITALFGRHANNLFFAFVLVLLAGLLASATPCVYPMLPITAAIFTARGAGSQQRSRLHALIYCLGIMGFYAFLGGIATLTGTAISAVMTNAWAHIGFAILFGYLGLSMLGFYEWPSFFASLLTKIDTLASRLSGFSGTLCMGATTGLIISPCVGPITGTILLDITGQVAHAQTLATTAGPGGVWRGVVLMTSFGLGLGIPFLAIGLLSSQLPSAGTWLTKTKYVIALPTLYFAYSYYEKGMEIALIPPQVGYTLLVALGLYLIAWYLRLSLRWYHRAVQYPGILICFIVATYLLYNAVTHPGFTYTQSSSAELSGQAPLAPPPAEMHANLRWERDFAQALQRARVEQKPLFIDFYATWCANCKAFQQLAVQNPTLNAALAAVVLVKIYDTDATFRVLQQDGRYPELRGIGGQPLLPLFAIYSARGELVWKGQDYQAVHTMVAQLAQASNMATP